MLRRDAQRGESVQQVGAVHFSRLHDPATAQQQQTSEVSSRGQQHRLVVVAGFRQSGDDGGEAPERAALHSG